MGEGRARARLTVERSSKTRQSSRYQLHIDRAEPEGKFVLSHTSNRTAVD